MKLTRRLMLNVRMQGGALYVYDMLLDGAVVGTMSVRINKKVFPWTDTTTYAIGIRTFNSLAEFKAELGAMNGGKP